jgi:16S rRNA (guanine527-N7)-methyltransferase
MDVNDRASAAVWSSHGRLPERLSDGMSDFAALAALDAEAARLDFALDQRARERFARYLELLIEWSPRAGLTSVTDPDAIQLRHFGESLALVKVLRDAGLATAEMSVVDLGSGGGLPGVPMLIADPSLALTMVESHERRCQFLELVVAELGFERATVVRARAEEAGHDPALRASFDLAVARAVAPLAVLVEYALPLLRRGGLLASPKGSRARRELTQAEAAIAALGGVVEQPLPLSLPPQAHPQLVLLVRRTGELDDRYPRRPGIPTKRPLA